MSGAPSSALRKGEETRREMRRPVKLTFIRRVPETPPARLLKHTPHPPPPHFPGTVAAGAIKTYHRMKKSTLLLKRFDFISRVIHTAAIRRSGPARPCSVCGAAHHKGRARAVIGSLNSKRQRNLERAVITPAVPVGCFSPAAALHLPHAGTPERAFL